MKGPVGVLSRNLRQQTDLLARLARPGVDQARHRADTSVDRGTGESRAGGKVVMARSIAREQRKNRSR